MCKKRTGNPKCWLVCLFCLVIALSTGLTMVWAAESTVVTYRSFTDDSVESLPIQPGGKQLAAKFVVPRGEMTKFTFDRMPTWSTSVNSFQFTLYAWKTSYPETIAQEPVMTKKIINHPDTADCVILFDTPIPSGRYLWVITDSQATNADGSRGSGVSPWLVNKSNLDELVCFDDGAEMKEGQYFKFSYETSYQASDPELGPETTPKPEDLVHYENQDLYQYTGNRQMPLASSGKELGGKFAVKKGQLLGLTLVNLPTWNAALNSFQFSLYEWKYDYYTSVSGTPLFTQYVEDHINEANCTFTFLEALPAGRYLWVMSDIMAANEDGSTGLGVSPWREINAPAGMEDEIVCFFEGEPLADYLSYSMSADEEAAGGPFCYYLVSAKIGYKDSDQEIGPEPTMPPATPTPEPTEVPTKAPSSATKAPSSATKTPTTGDAAESSFPVIPVVIVAVAVVAVATVVVLLLKKKSSSK